MPSHISEAAYLCEVILARMARAAVNDPVYSPSTSSMRATRYDSEENSQGSDTPQSNSWSRVKMKRLPMTLVGGSRDEIEIGCAQQDVSGRYRHRRHQTAKTIASIA